MIKVEYERGWRTGGSKNMMRIVSRFCVKLGGPNAAVLRHNGTPVQIALYALTQGV